MNRDGGPAPDALRVLVVEDNPADLALLRATLRRSELADAEVIEASRLSEAIERLDSSDHGRVDVVLLDLGLPDADGLEALHVLLDRRAAPPVVILTGNADERSAVAAVGAGAQDFLVKGQFEPAMLARVVRYAIERDRTVAMLRRLEAELVAERNRLVQAQRVARLGSWSYDPTSGEFTLSAEAASILDVDAGVHELASLLDRIDPASQDELVGAFERALAGHGGSLVVRWGASDPAPWLQVRVEPVDEAVRLVFGTVQDVTDREQAAFERAQLMTRIEHAQRLESLGRLAGGIAHNFNNLLAAMSMQAELLLVDLAEGSPVRTGIEDLRATVDRASALTRELLVFGRARDTPIETFSVNDLVRGVRSLLGQVIGETIEVELGLAADAGVIAADRNQIEQAIVNLAINARDAMEGGGRLLIRTRAPDGEHVEIAISDDGSGMTDDVRAHAIEPFFTTKSAERGTGLGLSIVHGSVVQAGGTLEIESAPGRGTTVAMRFPAAVPAAAVAVPTAPSAVGSTDASGDGLTALVVDDQPTIVRLVEALLKRQGFHVVTASSASEVLDTLSGGAPVDVVVSDLVMPGMSGRDLVLEIRRRRPSTAIVLMSGYSDGLLLDEELAAERFTFLGKPFTAAQLHDAIRRAVERTGLPVVAD